MPLLRHVLTAALAMLPLTPWAAAWPEHPITVVVPATAGGTTDIAARGLAEKMGKDLGVSIVGENKAGGGGGIRRAQRQIAQTRQIERGTDAENLPQHERDEHRNARVFADQPLRLVGHGPIVGDRDGERGPQRAVGSRSGCLPHQSLFRSRRRHRCR